jgi:hypothetical protein
MFDWYSKARICYAYLGGFHDATCIRNPDTLLSFKKSRWWTRGWTLQELLAPKDVEFYNSSWTRVGNKLRKEKRNIDPSYIGDLIADLTGIDIQYLNERSKLKQASVAEKMSWASLRQTTRVEDAAYSLLGIFGYTCL